MNAIEKNIQVQLSHSNWDIAQRSPKRSPRENRTTQNWDRGGQGQRSKVNIIDL